MNTPIPTNHVGPIKIISDLFGDEHKLVTVPLATYETPLWPSVTRGAKVSVSSGGINVVVVSDNMTRSALLEAPSARVAVNIVNAIKHSKLNIIYELATQTSNFIELQSINDQIVGNLIFLRFSFSVGNASGHNMTTKATDKIINWLISEYQELKYVSISANYCTDKKNSAVNGILGRGKYVIADMIVSKEICKSHLRTTPEMMSDLNTKKNLIGSIISGGVRSANAHFANMLLALYLTTGQDAANIVEGSQGFTTTEVNKNGDLYFAVTLPNVIVGTVGNGKHLDFVKNNLKMLDCLDKYDESGINNVSFNSQKLAAIVAATVWCGEISLLAAQTNNGELVKSHMKYERERC